MRPRTSSMLQQNNNNNYPCLSGSTREMLQKCSRVALPFQGRLELGDLPLIRGLRAWALCSKNRRKPVGGQAPLPPPPQKSPLPRPADVYLSGEWGNMGYGLPLGLDARQSGIGALVTVATLKTSEGNGKTQTQCLFLRTEKGSCLYSTAKPGSGGPASAVSGWLRGKTGGSKEAGRRDPGVQLQTGATRVRVRSGRRWRKSCNTAGLRRRDDPVRQEEPDKGGQEGASPPSHCESGSQRSPEEAPRKGILNFEKSEDFSSSSRPPTPKHDVDLQQSRPEDHQKTQTVDDPDSEVMKPQAGEVTPEEDPAEGLAVGTYTDASQEDREELEMVEERLCDVHQKTQTEDAKSLEVTKHLVHRHSGCEDFCNEPKDEPDPSGSSRSRLDVGSSREEVMERPCCESQESGLLNLEASLCDMSRTTQTVGSEMKEAGDLSIPPVPEQAENELSDPSLRQVPSTPAEGSTCRFESHTNLRLEEQEPDEGWENVSDLTREPMKEEMRSEFPQGQGNPEEIWRHCAELERGGVELVEEQRGSRDGDDDEDVDQTCQEEEEQQRRSKDRTRGEERGTCREKFQSTERHSNVADLLHSPANPAPLGVMATSPPHEEEEEVKEVKRGVDKTGRGAQEGSERHTGELENLQEKLVEEEERDEEEEEEDEFGVFMQAESERGRPETTPADQVVDESSKWTPDWTQSSSLADDSWTAFPTAEERGLASGQWWPAEEGKKGRSQNLESVFTEAFPSLPRLSDDDLVPSLTQILRGSAGQHKRLLDSFHDLNKMIVQRNKRASGASHELLLKTLEMETPPPPDSRPAPWPANRRPSPGLSSANRSAQMAASKRRLSYDHSRNNAE